MSKQIKREPTVKLTGEQISSLVSEINDNRLSAESKALLITILTTFAQIQQLLATKRLGLLTLLRRIFGLKTERHKNSDGDKPSHPSPNDKKKEKVDKVAMA